MEEKRECYITCTIEKQLKRYTECEDHTERHELLWHEWNHNKRWLTHVQQLILPSFPAYSMHDSTHSESILHNIEMLLGEYNITSLSATDCFLILHTAYIHDIGMCITHADKIDMIKNKKFHKFLEEICLNGTSDMSKYANTLLKKCISYNHDLENLDYADILEKKLEIYYAITYLMAEYRRKEHGDISSDRLIEWVNSPEKLGIGFSAIEIPNRLFYIIANCANTHTKWDFKTSILKLLRQEDSGFAHDYVHPRFIAILLQLGDALDMDNNRFHPLSEEYLGNMPETSEIHRDKHKAIRRLRITNQKISVSADCQSQDVLRLVRQECDGIRKILKDASYYWSVIRPKELNIGLPTFEQTELLLNGKKIPDELVKTKFEISQEKAFHLLEGNNIYVEENFVFLRELLQNAVDATKIQYFRDCKQKSYRSHGTDINDISTPQDFKRIISPSEYSIELELINGFKNNEHGVLVKIQDYGTGISEKDINQIAKVGTSYESRRNEIEEMPKWLQPTGTFGIGLQSVFLPSKVLKATTCTRKDECYEITFYPRSGKGNEGYINVKPTDTQNKMIPYGTSFELFISHKKKKLHNESPEAWSGKDPFEEGYDKTRGIRHTRELIKQMAFYLKDMIGEPLFPINLWIYDDKVSNEEELNYYYGELKKNFQDAGMKIYIRKNKEKENKDKSSLTWIYGMIDERKIEKDDKNGDLYYLDLEKIKLYVWNQEYNVYTCVSIQRILNLREQLNYNESQTIGMKIFYKGIKIAEKSFKQDANLIEYIDIKDTLNNNLLKLNRNGFSREGEEYLEKVYKKVLISVQNALSFFSKKSLGQRYTDIIIKKIEGKLDYTALNDDKDKRVQAEKIILSTTALIYFSLINEWDEFFGVHKDNEQNTWNIMLEKIIEVVENAKENIPGFSKALNNSTLFDFPAWKMTSPDARPQSQHISILDIINIKKKYAIISVREEKSHFWNEYIIEIGFDIHKKIKDEIVKLRKEIKYETRIDIMKRLNENVEKIIEFDYNYEEKCNERKTMHIIRWLLKNIPTMAIFASNDGNTRLNILDLDICDSIYFDFSMQNLTFERMCEKYEQTHISRFSTTVWSGYCFLGLKEKPNSILSVTRGMRSDIGGTEMIFPLVNEKLNSIYNEIKKDIEEIRKCIECPINRYLTPVRERIENTESDNYEQIFKRYFEYIQKKINEITGDTTVSKSKFDKNDCDKALSEMKDNIYETNLDVIYAIKNTSNQIDKFIQKKYKFTCGECEIYVESESESNKETEVIELNIKESYKNLVNYIMGHAKRNPLKEQIDMLYENYLNEIIHSHKYIFFKKIYTDEKLGRYMPLFPNIKYYLYSPSYS